MKQTLLTLLAGIALLSAGMVHPLRAQEETKDVITIYTQKPIGQKIELSVRIADGESFEVVGASQGLADDPEYYTVEDKKIQIIGPVERLWCSQGQIDSMDVSQTRSLFYLSCGNNRMKKLTIGQNSNLTNLHCYGNELRTLDLSGAPKLQVLNCYYNYLSTLTVENLPDIDMIACYYCYIYGANMTNLMMSLPQREKTQDSRLYIVDYGTPAAEEVNRCYESDVKIATDKGWNVYNFDGGSNDGNGRTYPGKPDSERPTSIARADLSSMTVSVDAAAKRCTLQGAPAGEVGALLNAQGLTVQIFQVDAQGNAALDLSALPGGLYFVSVALHNTKIIL